MWISADAAAAAGGTAADWQLVLHVLLLGMVQGFTEFLPISSSAHLLLAQRLFALPYYGKTFDLVLHLGSLGAVLYFFRPELGSVTAGAWRFLRSGGRVWPERIEERWGAVVLIATVPTSCAGFLVDPWAESHLQGPLLMAAMLALFGVLLGGGDFLARRRETAEGKDVSELRLMNSVGWKTSLALGLAQSLAFIPGVSRAGISLTAARLLGLPRGQAVRVSMLMSVPVIAGAVLVKTASGAVSAIGLPLPLIGLGVMTSAACSWLSLRLLARAGRLLQIAACYRVALAVIIVFLFCRS